MRFFLCIYSCPSLSGFHHREVECEAGEPSAQHVDSVVGIDVNGGETEQHVEWDEADKEATVAAVPCQQHDNGAHADMTAWEGCGGTLAGFVGALYHLVEESVGIPRANHAVAVVIEIVVKIGEDAPCNLIEARRRIIILRTGNGNEHIEGVVDEERTDEHERGASEIVVSKEEVEEYHEYHHGKVRGVAHVHQFADHGM